MDEDTIFTDDMTADRTERDDLLNSVYTRLGQSKILCKLHLGCK